MSVSLVFIVYCEDRGDSGRAAYAAAYAKTAVNGISFFHKRSLVAKR